MANPTETLYYCLPILIGFIFIIRYINRPSKAQSKSCGKRPPLPPSPPSLPIIGHLHHLKEPYHRSLKSLSSLYGPIFHLRIGRRLLLVVSSPQAAEECLTKSNDIVFANRPDLLSGEILSYNCSTLIWSPYGEHWRNLRRVTTLELFSSQRILYFSSIRADEVRSMVRAFYKVASSSSSSPAAGVVNLHEALFQLTRNVIMRIVNGKKWVNGPANEQFLAKPLISVYDFFPVMRWVGYKGVEKTMVALRMERDKFMQSMIDEARTKIELQEEQDNNNNNNNTPNNNNGAITSTTKITMLEELVSLQKSQPEYYTDEIIKGIILVIFTAGIETTAYTTEWAMSLLLNHPSAYNLVRDEIDAHMVGANKTPTRLVEDSDLPNFPYLRCVVYETLRLFPVVPILVPHLASSETTVGGYHVPRGTVLFINAWAMHRDPKVWEDPLEFKPERFLSEEGRVREINGFKFLPFGVGRRACPGSNMGIRMICLALATMVQCFDWERVEGGDGSMSNGFEEETGGAVTMTRSEPLRAVCKTRPYLAKILSEL